MFFTPYTKSEYVKKFFMIHTNWNLVYKLQVFKVLVSSEVKCWSTTPLT